MLYRGRHSARSGCDRAIEDGLSRLSAVHCIGHGIRLLLVRVSGPADSTGQFRPAALLYDVRCFVSGKLNIRLAAESDAITRGISQ
jgi:hypothetical protein